jgi:phospholipase C
MTAALATVEPTIPPALSSEHADAATATAATATAATADAAADERMLLDLCARLDAAMAAREAA